MPSPSTSLATLRPDLGGSMEEFDLAMDRAGFIATRVLPVIEAAEQAGKFGKIPVEALLKVRDTKRAARGGYSRSDWEFTDDSYATEEHGAEDPVDEREAKMYRHYFDAELMASQRARDAVLRNAEIRAAALIFNATTWTGAPLFTSITNEWDDAANATPVTDVEAAVRKVYDNSGLWPNALIINRKVFRNLRLVDSIIDMVKQQGFQDVRPGKVTIAHFQALFDLEHIIVAGSSKDSANEGQATTFAQIWSDEYAMVCRVAESQDIREPCVGRTIHWAEDGSEIGGTLETYRDETIRSDVARCRHDVDEKTIHVESGHLLGNITT